MSAVSLRPALLGPFVLALGLLDAAPRAAAAAPATYARLPLRFEANAGQFGAGTRFVARRGGALVALGDERAVLALGRGRAIGLRVDGGRRVEPRGELPAGVTHYLRGRDPAGWRTNVPAFARVVYPGVLEGVDLVYHGEGGALEYDLVVSPGADVEGITLAVDGGDVDATPSGDLVIHTPGGDLVQPRPLVYQTSATGAREIVASSYRIVGRGSVGFTVAAFDRARPLVIDPVVAFSTYLGGGDLDAARGIAVDSSGNAYVAGNTRSADFPIDGPLQAVFGGCASPCTGEHAGDVFVAKLDPSGSSLDFATYIGGTGDDVAHAIAVTGGAEAVVVGSTTSADFPISSPRVVNPTYAAGREAFVLRLGARGDGFAYSTFLAGGGDDEARGVAVDASGAAYVVGATSSTDLGAPDGLAPPSTTGAFLAKIPASGASIELLRYLRGGGDDVAVGVGLDAARDPYVVGTTTSPLGASCAAAGPANADVFVAHYAAAAGDFDFVRCLGGAGAEAAAGVAVAGDGAVFVAGTTSSADFPATPGTLQATAPAGPTSGFVARLSPGGAIERATYLGGEASDRVSAIAVDGSGAPWLVGRTTSSGFPTRSSIQAARRGAEDAFVTRLAADLGSTGFSTYFGGGGADGATSIALSPTGIWVAGETASIDLPTLSAWQSVSAGGSDAFALRIGISQLVVTPAEAALPAGGTQQFFVTGGTGGYTFTLAVNGSGATLGATGAYAAGIRGGTTDVVQITDEAGSTATATVRVAPVSSALVLSPARAVTPPRGSLAFTVAGGAPPYTFGYVSNASGGFVNQQGRYEAGTRGGVQDIVRVVDATSAAVTALVSVSDGVAITPARPTTPPRGTIAFAAAGGSGGGFAWSLAKNESSGSIDPATGLYTAGASARAVDTVRVQDALGNVASVNVSVGGGLAIAPAQPAAPTRGRVAFEAFGGAGPFVWSLPTNASNGSVDGASGLYVAGATGDVVDVVAVHDALGNASSVDVAVGPALALLPGSTAVAAGARVAFSAAGGSGEGYGFRVEPNPSGGTISADGLYVAGPSTGLDVVRLVDSLGGETTANVAVTAAEPPADAGSAAPAGFDGVNLAGGGPGGCAASARNTTSAGRGLAALALVGLALRRHRRRRVT